MKLTIEQKRKIESLLKEGFKQIKNAVNSSVPLFKKDSFVVTVRRSGATAPIS